MEQMRCIKHVGFLLGSACAQQHCAVRYAHAYGEKCLEHGFIGVVAETSYLACRGHVDTEHGVGTSKT